MTSIKTLCDARFGEGVSNDNSQTCETIETLLQHRTHRVYRDEPINEDIINAVLAATFSAPSKSDLQQASLIHVRSPDKREAIAELIPAMPWIRDCSEFFIFCADGRRIQRIAEIRSLPFENDNADNFLAAVCDAGLAMQSFITAAESLGLGCCPISVIRNHIERVSEIVDLPSRVIPIAGMCVGYPSREGFVSMRLPPSVMCHTDSYDDSQLAEHLSTYDKARDARFSLPADRQKYTGRFGQADFYGWSEDKARQMAVEERQDVGDFIRAHGFSLR